MNIPAFTLKRIISILLVFITIFMGVEASGSRPKSVNTGSVTPGRIEPRISRPDSRVGFRPYSRSSGLRPESKPRGLRLIKPELMGNIGTSPRPNPSRNRSRTSSRQSHSQQQFPQNSTTRNSSPSRPETLDFQTKLVLVAGSFFTLIFMVVLLIIGHFTWFAAVRKELEEEWEEELRKEEERHVSKTILREMTNPFKNLEDVDNEEDKCVEIRRRDSIDSDGCTQGLCVPPHHSILCPYNSRIPQLNEPFTIAAFDPSSTTDDPIEYRNTASRWMNLESCVRIREPVPLRDRMMSYSTSFLSSTLPKRPMTPLTPDPAAPEIESDRDLEVGKFGDSFDLKSSPTIKFDLSKLDLI